MVVEYLYQLGRYHTTCQVFFKLSSIFLRPQFYIRENNDTIAKLFSRISKEQSYYSIKTVMTRKKQ